MIGHTPGPWISSNEGYGDGMAIVRGPNREWIAEMPLLVFCPSGDGDVIDDPEKHDEYQKNRRLVEAAPDLFKELSFVVDNEEQSSFESWLSRVTPSGDCDAVHAQWLESSEYHDFCDLWSGPIAAIAKAKGDPYVKA